MPPADLGDPADAFPRRRDYVPDERTAAGLSGARARPETREARLAELRARVEDRLPPAWRSARWSLPGPAALAVLVVVVVLAGTVAAVLVLGRPAAQPQTVPARELLPAATAAPTAVPPAPAGDTGAAGGPQAPAAVQTGAPQTAARQVVVHVVGQVASPGVVRLPSGARVADAVDAAGGVSGEADLTLVNLARTLADGEQVHVPRPGEQVAPPAAVPPGLPSSSAPSSGAASAMSPLDLNAATAADLDALPGIGPVLSQRIVDWRDQHGRFTSVDELGEVSGIGPSVLERLRPLVRV